MKRCAKCGQVKDEASFNKNSRSTDGLDFRCRECLNAYRRAYLASHPEAHENAKAGCRQWHAQHQEVVLARAKKHYQHNKAHHRATRWMRQYGITPEQYGALLVAQDRRCAICRGKKIGGGCRYWHVDHDHATGTVRGLLCSSCNNMLARARDSVEVLSRAIKYLSDPPAPRVWTPSLAMAGLAQEAAPL
jgi:hypothetical protein